MWIKRKIKLSVPSEWLSNDFTLKELEPAIPETKNRKAAGFGKLCLEIITR